MLFLFFGNKLPPFFAVNTIICPYFKLNIIKDKYNGHAVINNLPNNYIFLIIILFLNTTTIIIYIML